MTISAPSKTASSPHASGELDIPIPLVAAGITVAGALLVGYAIHRWNGAREKAARRASASKEFRTTINDAIATLDALNLNAGIEITHAWATDRHSGLALAVDNFAPFLPASERIALRKDWSRYCQGTNKRGEPDDPESFGMSEEQHRYLCYSENSNQQSPRKAQSYAREALTKLLQHASEA